MLNFTFYVSLMSVNYIIKSAGALICKLTEMMAIASITIIGYNLFLDQSEPFELFSFLSKFYTLLSVMFIMFILVDKSYRCLIGTSSSRVF